MRKLAVVGVVCACAVAGASASSEAQRPRGLILFWSDTPWPSIWAMRADGSKRHRIFRSRRASNTKRPTLSPDCKWVVFDGGQPDEPPITNLDVQLARLDGTERRTVTAGPDWDIDAQWSPGRQSVQLHARARR